MKTGRWLVGAVSMSVVLASAAAGCSSKQEDTTLSRDELLDPQTCNKCHKDLYDEWSGSMHAYAAEDPIFLAFNKRMQRETNGALGDFCVKCHAPMAVRDGLTKDGSNLAQLPQKYRGVTCFFCHTAESVGELHNNGLVPGDPTTMRGPFADPVKNTAHHAVGSAFHNQKATDSAKMCGSCHDIVTPAGAFVERTFDDWTKSVFSHGSTGQTCGQCHMRPSGTGPIADYPGVFAREKHPHHFAGVDRALTPFPNMDAQKAKIGELFDSSIQASACVSQGTSVRFRVVLDNVFAGHTFPSGSAQDRRMWIELVAKKGDQVVYQTGVVDDGKQPDPANPDVWLLRDFVYDGKSPDPIRDFGLATCYESQVLPYPTTADMSSPDFYKRNIYRDFPADGTLRPAPDTVTLRLRMLPVGYDVLDDLVASGDLDPAIRSKMVPMDVGPTTTWTLGTAHVARDRDGTAWECVTITNQSFGSDKYPPPVNNTCGK